ncbi:hypothetical protein IMG5_162290 [Ichthyophthirius multifiliis]|uniref:Uncharacterized protein n=1 Tax=Ichthyophthirius multifiliis TaxID=5932 RepID=G0R066_ICHMU|nr:hypothetical protein IMG5_162290 [Ichthyophthirius multifiliis]EGR29126.1 hypothetical protein IMG5_162290 [Ichthyophthirius multifiliis]|eukprot:XP_004030362.1 hypothetical protein IMG5_162290 [Ichthyophthirius multifiliis]
MKVIIVILYDLYCLVNYYAANILRIPLTEQDLRRQKLQQEEAERTKEREKNSWEKIVQNINLKASDYLGSQDVSKMREFDAFVALGGNIDKSGFVKKKLIMEIIKKEFDLIIDIEDLIDRSQSSQQEIDFSDFCQIFENGGEEIKSKVSLLSNISRQKSTTNLGGQQGFQVKYKDFELWLERMDGKI